MVDVILNGGEAGVRDPMSAESFDGVDGNAPTPWRVADRTALVALDSVVRSQRARALFRMTSR
jgi:hypothetical protein